MECYVSASSAGAIESLTSRAWDAATQMWMAGTHVRLLGFITLLEEDTVFCLLVAPHRVVVEDLNLRMGGVADRIVDVVHAPARAAPWDQSR
jgi:hypothetical protein